MLGEKANVICLLQILQNDSDEDHILSMGRIIEKMRTVYGTAIDRRTVYGAIAVLNELGYDISIYEENKKGYYLRERPLEVSEAHLLMDSVVRSPFISEKHSMELLNKIQKLMSKPQRKRYRHLFTLKPSSRTLNKEIFYTIDVLDEAIGKRQKVSFIYLEYGFDKKLKARRPERYVINPYATVCANEQYYLVCNYDKYDNLSLYRIDRIKDIQIVDEKRKPSPDNFNIQAFVNQSIYMFTDCSETVVMRCENHILGDVLDKFGLDTIIHENPDDTFTATINAASRGLKFWALQYLPYVEVLSPGRLRDEIISDIKKNPYQR